MATLATLRCSLGVRTGQQFFRTVGLGAGIATGGSTTTLIDTTFLTQEDDFWNGQMVYLPASQKTRTINDHVAADKTISWIEPVTAVDAADVYEIWAQFSPFQVHEALNQALRDAWPAFFTYETDYLVIQDDVGITYSLAGFSPAPKIISRVLLEGALSGITGTSVASPGADTTLKDTDQTFTEADVGKGVRIFKGKSQGDYRTVSACVDANTLTVSAAFTSELDDTSRYALMDIEDEGVSYGMMPNWGVDNLEGPTVLRLSHQLMGYQGRLLRVEYEAEYEALSAEADATTCPREFVELSALARLLLMRMASAPSSELRNWTAVQRATAEAAESYAQKNRFTHRPTQIRNDQAGTSWRTGDYPF